MVFGDDLKQALTTARTEAHRLRHASVRPEHHALGVLLAPSATVSTVLAGIPAADLVSELEQRAGLGTTTVWLHDLPYAQDSRDVIEYALKEARALGHEVVGCDHLLLGLLQVDGSLPYTVLKAHGLAVDQAREVVRVARSEGAT